jgi:hypothetical protein
VAIRRGMIPADSFTIISNAWLRDPRLRWSDKGLLAYIASHAAGHSLTLDQIVAEGQDGEDAVRASLSRCETAGYLRRIDVRNERGHRIGTDYELCEPAQVGKSQVGDSPTSADQQERNVSAGQPQTGKSQVGKSDPKKTTPPTVVKKTTEKTPSASPRGTRIPADWKPSSELGQWLLGKLPEGRWTDHNSNWARHETEKFTLYWKTKTGAQATKIDWGMTWQNWMLKALERYRPGATGNAAPQQFKTAQEKRTEEAETRMVVAHLAQALLDARPGMDPSDAYAQANAEVRRRVAAGEPVSVDSCTVTGYIDGGMIQTNREVTA